MRQSAVLRPPSSRTRTASAVDGQSEVPTSVFALASAAVSSGASQRLSPITAGTPLLNRTNWKMKIIGVPSYLSTRQRAPASKLGAEAGPSSARHPQRRQEQ